MHEKVSEISEIMESIVKAEAHLVKIEKLREDFVELFWDSNRVIGCDLSSFNVAKKKISVHLEGKRCRLKELAQE